MSASAHLIFLRLLRCATSLVLRLLRFCKCAGHGDCRGTELSILRYRLARARVDARNMETVGECKHCSDDGDSSCREIPKLRKRGLGKRLCLIWQLAIFCYSLRGVSPSLNCKSQILSSRRLHYELHGLKNVIVHIAMLRAPFIRSLRYRVTLPHQIRKSRQFHRPLVPLEDTR